MRSIVLIVLALAAPATARSSDSEPPYHVPEPIREAKVFHPGRLCTGDSESYPAFSEFGTSLFFVKSTPDGKFRTIVESRYAMDWEIPVTPPFSGQFDDFAPFITTTGTALYFASNRPALGVGSPQRHSDLWVVERTESGWGEARWLEQLNGPGNETSACVAPDGTIYFSSDRAGGHGGLDLYRCPIKDGRPGKVENLGKDVNSAGDETDPRFASESTLIFAARGRSDGAGGYDLYVTKADGARWSRAENLGGRINSVSDDFAPCLAPGGKYIFWTSTRSFADVVPERAWQYPELLGRIRSARNGLGDLYLLERSALGVD